jgi:glycosyltransferase involved in cell wall biosynthesis
MKVAIIADWLTDFGGAERVILKLHKLFPDAPIFTSVFNKDNMKEFEGADIRTSFLQKIPLAKKKHQMFLSLMPLAFEHFDLSEFDVVISSAHSCAKGVITKPETMHICYCHSPMRYVWDNCHSYIKNYNVPILVKKLAQKPLHKLRLWDKLAADRVDFFIANSATTQQRIKKYYKRESSVIYPMVDLDRFEPARKENYFVAIGRLIPYKKFDLTVQTFNKLGLPLKIIGTGIEEEKLKKMAKGNIEFLGRIEDQKASEIIAKAKALIFPQLEDFGITPLEAMACGVPVIAYKKGGATETVTTKSGVFFKEQTVKSLEKAIKTFLKKKFSKKEIKAQAQKFSPSVFDKKIIKFIENKWEIFNHK